VTASCRVGVDCAEVKRRSRQASLSSRTAVSLPRAALRFLRWANPNSSRRTSPNRGWAPAEGSSKVSMSSRSSPGESLLRRPAAGLAGAGPHSSSFSTPATLSGSSHTMGSAPVATIATRLKSYPGIPRTSWSHHTLTPPKP